MACLKIQSVVFDGQKNALDPRREGFDTTDHSSVIAHGETLGVRLLFDIRLYDHIAQWRGATSQTLTLVPLHRQ